MEPARAPTEEQLHILNLAGKTSSNIMMNALAGTGKTTTLEMTEKVVKQAPILYLAFSKPVALEAEKRMLSTTQVRTFNSLGHRIWAKAVNKNLSLDPKKTQALFRALVDEAPKAQQDVLWTAYWAVVQGVGLAKALGYVPEGKFPNARRLITQGVFHAALDERPDDLVSDLIDAILTRSCIAAYEGRIDFNDQIYMPALFGGTFPQFPLVTVDEYQDLNPTNHAMLDKLAKHRLIGVGDPWQNIYGFRGAKQGGMGQAQEKFKMTPCDLSISFRCPQAIVEAVHWHVPHFRWTKSGGHVETLHNLRYADIDDTAVFICRNNAPLFRLAVHLLSAKRSVSVAGTELGPTLLTQMKRLGDESLDRDGVLAEIDGWLEEKLSKGSKTAPELAECMKVFAGFGNTLGQAIAVAEHVLAQQGAIRLMTGHKSKGLEFPTVYHLDPHIIGDGDQERNLRYVIQTRSMDRYFEIDSESIHE